MSNEPNPPSEQPTDDHAPESIDANHADTDPSDADQHPTNESPMADEPTQDDLTGAEEASEFPADAADRPEAEAESVDDDRDAAIDVTEENAVTEEDAASAEDAADADDERAPLADLAGGDDLEASSLETVSDASDEDSITTDDSATDDSSAPEDANEPASSTAPAPSPASSAAPKPKPTGTLGTVKAATVWLLQTVYQGLHWASTQLKAEHKADSKDSTTDEPPASQKAASSSVAKTIEGLLAQVFKTVAIALITAFSFVISTGLKLLGADTQAAPGDSSPSLIGGIASTVWGIVRPILKQIWRLWRRLLAILRSRILPDAIKPLTDVTLTIITVGIVYSLVWVTSAISPDASTATPPPSRPGVVSPTSQPSSSSVSTKEIAAIQTQLAEATSPFGDEVVQAAQVDALGDRLTVTLGWDWYRLDARQQDQLANALLQTSQDLQFENLEVLVEGDRVARSPVIGSTMIVFERTSDKLAEIDRIAAEKAAAEKAAAEKAAAEKAAAEKAAAEKAAAEAEQAAAEAEQTVENETAAIQEELTEAPLIDDGSVVGESSANHSATDAVEGD
jgi:hypothetical protein